MGDASYAQTSFLGGEISKWAQGQFDRPEYKTSLAKASNILIVDEGAAPRRPGFQFLGTTRNGAPGRQLPFDFSETSPYNMEFTDGFLRFWNGNSLVTTNDSQTVSAVSNGSPAVFTLPTAVTWETGDEVYFTFNNPAEAAAGNLLLNRQFVLTMITNTTFSVTDAITGQVINASMFAIVSGGNFSFDGPLSSGPISDGPLSASPALRTVIQNISPTVNHIAQIITPYTVAGNDWHSLRAVQGLNLSMLLHTSVSPQALQVLSFPTSNKFAVFSYNAAVFQDGPYLDPPANAIATPSGLSGVIQVVVGYAAWISSTVYGTNVLVTYNGQDYFSLTNGNAGNTPSTSPTNWQALAPGSSIGTSGFVSTDVGRALRLFSAPQAWAAGTTYAAGNSVSYNGSYFTSLVGSNTNNQPDISLTDWSISTSAAVWTWGTITSVTAPNQVSVQLQGGNLLYTTPCPAFRIGAWSNTTGWPTCGCYYGGRFWFGGAIPNRVDSSQPDTPFIMSPTQPDGTVTDSNGITYTFNSNSVDQILNMEPLSTGIMVMTAKGEYLLNSGTNGGPITPSSILESPATKYGSANVLPVKTGLTVCFVQKYARRLLEYLADVFSQRYYGPDLTTYARHIGARGFQELAYQQEPAPVVWARMGDGSLVGTTYRRVSLFSNQKPEFNAWHQHPLGSGRLVESICVGPSTNTANILDTLSMVTNDPATNIRYVESLTPLMDETDPLTQAWFLDAAVTPQAALLTNNAVTFYGLTYLNGKIATVFAAGLDCGDYLVENGQITVPLGTKDNTTGYTFDTPQFNILQPKASTFASNSVTVFAGAVQYKIPAVIGLNYQSKGQLCRPMMPIDTGTKNGPAFAKKKKTARYGIHLINSLGVQIGIGAENMVPVKIVSPSGNLPPYLSMYSGIVRESLQDTPSYDSMLMWITTRPFPATVVTIGGFISTEDL
jgi:hypothetical protein